MDSNVVIEGGNMSIKHDAISYDFTFKELQYFLFKKKICPKCGHKLVKRKDFQTVRGSELNSKSEAFFVPSAKVKQYHYFFSCEDCGSEFSLKELAIKGDR